MSAHIPQSTRPSTVPEQSLPFVGMSRWAQLRKLIPVSRETWRQLVIAGRAPAPVRLSERCSLYPNAEIHAWLADPANYRQAAGGAQ